MKSTLIAAIILAFANVNAETSHVQKQAVSIQAQAAEIPQPEVWWLRPRVETWRSFDFIQLEGQPKKRLLASLKGSEYSATGGSYYLMDVPFLIGQKKAQGFLILRTPGREITTGLRIRENAADMRSLSFVDVTLFSPNEKKFAYKWTGSFEGVVLKTDFRAMLLKSQDHGGK